MKNNNKVQVLLFSKYSLEDFTQRELVKWLGTTLQPIIVQQDETTKKLFLKTLKDTPAIYLS